jgi:two-component system response regulator DegU
MAAQSPDQIPSSKNPLTKRQTQVLRLFAEGYTDKEIADMLYLAEDTIRTHRNAIRARLECKNTTMAVAMAIRNGWI